jgi:hypothetical protein
MLIVSLAIIPENCRDRSCLRRPCRHLSETQPRVIAKVRPSTDSYAKKFIAMSPFCVLATSGADGSVDASPRGGIPGFVHVESSNLLLMPDRSGNNRIDSFRNIVEGGLVHCGFEVWPWHAIRGTLVSQPADREPATHHPFYRTAVSETPACSREPGRESPRSSFRA